MKFQSHSDTSRWAAQAIEGATRTLRARTYRYLHRCGETGATDAEMQEASGMNPSTQRPRRIELVELGLVQDSRRTRPTPSGRAAVVWVAVPREQQMTLI